LPVGASELVDHVPDETRRILDHDAECPLVEQRDLAKVGVFAHNYDGVPLK
jgi:hypothetical protein